MQAFKRYFAAKEKIGEVKKVLQKAAETNKRKLPELDITPQVRSWDQNVLQICFGARQTLQAPLPSTSSTPCPSLSARW